MPGAAASSSSEPMVAQPGVYVVPPTYRMPDSASAEVLPPPAKERRTESDTGRRVLDLPSRYTATISDLVEASEEPDTPETESETWDPTHDPEHVGTSVPDPTNVPGVQNVVRDSTPSSEGEARITFNKCMA